MENVWRDFIILTYVQPIMCNVSQEISMDKNDVFQRDQFKMLVQKCAHNYINLKNGYQPIQLDNTIFRTTGTYNFICMEMCSKTDSMENNYNKITVVN